MIAPLLQRRPLVGLLPISVAGVLVLAGAAATGGSQRMLLAASAVGLTLAIFAASERVAAFAEALGPLERMLVVMGVRGGLAAAALVGASLAEVAEPKELALVALPMYLSLVVGEVAAAAIARRTAEPHGGEPATPTS